MDAVEDLYLRIADRYTGIRRIEVCANRVAPESYVQYSLFDDPKQTDKERHLQEAVLNVKQRYGKNAIMRGSICWSVPPIENAMNRLVVTVLRGGAKVLASAYQPYLYLPRPVSRRHPMDVGRRAKQFAPFAALRGLDETIRQQEIIYEPKRDLSEEKKMSWI